jgi:TonB family protein
MRAEPIQDKQAQQAIEQVAASRAKLEIISSSMMLSIRKILSKEQWNKLSAMQTSQRTQVFSGAAKSKLPEELKQMDMMAEEPYAVGDRVNAPEILSQPKPNYTQAARDARIEGTILLQLIVRKDGTAGSFKVVQGLGYGLDESAISTIANKWRFKPGTLNNKPVDVRVTIEVSFRLY